MENRQLNSLRFIPSGCFFGQAFTFVAALVLAGTPATAQSNNFWRSQSIYQVMTDRFFDGDASNNNADGNYNPSNNHSVHGGDFKGVEQKLDYIKALGATAVWISPVVLNGSGQFHGYAARDFYKVDPHWGSLSNLQHFVQAAHARGLLVIDDIIVNHGDDLIYSTDAGYGNFVYPPAGYTLKYRSSSKIFAPPFDVYNSTYNSANNALTNLFHNYGTIQNYNDLTQVQLGELAGLDDFRTESDYVRSNMAAIYEYWIRQAGFDGFRIDTVKHVDTGFWRSWCPAVHAFAATNGVPNFFMFGEVYDGNEALCGSYTGTEGGGPFLLDSVVDYPLYFTVNSVFATATGNTQQIEDHYHNVDANYDPAAQMSLVTFLDNHDQARFLSSGNANGNTNRLAVALEFLYTSRGIPCLYYGTEQAFNGGNDPYDREDMFAGQFKDGPAGVDSFNMSHPLFQLVARLNNFRRLYPALSLGSHVNQWFTPGGPGLFAYTRVLSTQEVFVVFNTADTNQILPARTLTYPSGTVLENLLNTNETIVMAAGSQTPPITVPGTTAKIFIAQSLWQPLDPVVVSNFPAHAASGISTASSVVLQFSEPMDANSVQSAFATSPAIGGTFSWSAAGDTMTFTPNAPGFAALTNITVTVGSSALGAVTGKIMVAPYALFFQTAAAPPSVYVSSPASDESFITMTTNTTFFVQTCFTPTLDTNDPSLFTMTINGVPQPQSSFIFRPVGAVAGCPGMRSLFYDWNSSSPGTIIGTNLLKVVYSNSSNGLMLSTTRTVIVPPPLMISGLVSNNQTVVWSSTPGSNYMVLATTNLAQPFTPISGVISASGLSTSYQDLSNSPPTPQKFYEIKVVP
jgi:alpha-amylase